MNLEISEIQILKTEEKEAKVKGIASVLVNNAFAIHGIRIIVGKNGLFIAMPSRKTSTGEYRDIVHPINKEARKIMEDAILEEYKKLN